MTDTASTTADPAPVIVPFAGINEQIARLVRHADEYRSVLDKKLKDPAVRRRPSSLFAAHCLAEAESGQLRHALDLAEMEVRDAAALLDEAMILLRRTSMAAAFYVEWSHLLEEELVRAGGIDVWKGKQQ